MKYLYLITIIFFFVACSTEEQEVKPSKEQPTVDNSWGEKTNRDVEKKIEVLNVGTFHFGTTSDAKKTEFDENSVSNKEQAHKIATLLAKFKPTVIVVEYIPEFNKDLQEIYQKYLQDPTIMFEENSEVNLLAYEVGRLSGAKRIFGIDHQLGYDYAIGDRMKNNIDSISYRDFKNNPHRFNILKDIAFAELDLLTHLKLINSKDYLNYLYQTNADILTYVGSENGFEGADQAAEFYKRNLRMFSNLNRIPLNENDRVFILMGAAHTAFFNDFIGRSNKYKLINTTDYLK